MTRQVTRPRTRAIRTTIYVEQHTHAQLKVLAHHFKAPLNRLYTDALNRYLENNYDLLMTIYKDRLADDKEQPIDTP